MLNITKIPPMDNSASGFKEFVKAAFRDPRNVSTIFPSLKYLAQALIRHSEMGEGHHVLELGSGSGAITHHILKRRSELASYTGIEIDKNLVSYLQNKYPNEKFLALSADNLKEHIPDESMDTVICSLPWTMFAGDMQEAITKEILRVLKPGGHFTTFLCIHALSYPGAPRAKKVFKEAFSKFEKCESIARNIPPANVYKGTK